MATRDTKYGSIGVWGSTPADAGDFIAPPADLITSGFTSAYFGPTGTPMRGQHFNEMLRQITAALEDIKKWGALPWIATQQYAAGSICVSPNDALKRARRATLNENPDTVTAAWEDVSSGLGVTFNRYTAGGTWTKPANASLVFVEVIGGGASGEAQRNAIGSGDVVYGGAAGFVTQRMFQASDLGATETIRVGAGGRARASSGVKVGVSRGAESAFGSLRGSPAKEAWKAEDSSVADLIRRLRAGEDGDWGGSGGRITNTTSYGGELTPTINGGAPGRSGSANVNGGNGRDTNTGKGSGGGAAYYRAGIGTGVGGHGGVPGGGGGAGRRQGGDGGRGEVRVWTW